MFVREDFCCAVHFGVGVFISSQQVFLLQRVSFVCSGGLYLGFVLQKVFLYFSEDVFYVFL